jgi:large subunit ribosomal protein L17
LLHKRISTTLAKAKELRKYIEPLITRGKEDTTHSRRVVFSYLHNKFAVSELFREISQKVGDRPGGYTRILKTGFRKGDNAEMCIIELVDYNETYTPNEEKKKTTKTRRGRGGKAKTDEANVAESSTSASLSNQMQKAESKNEVIVEEPVAEDVIIEEAIVEEIITEETITEETVVEEEQIVEEVKIAEEPEVKKSIVEEVKIDEPVAEEPIEEDTGEVDKVFASRPKESANLEDSERKPTVENKA